MMTTSEALNAKIVAIASDVPPEVLAHICRELELLGENRQHLNVGYLTASIAQPKARQIVADLLAVWQQIQPSIPPLALAWALRGASLAVEHCTNEQKLELVWTGPAPANAGLRRTDQALFDVIGRAEERLIIVTFVAYQMAIIITALADAAARGVKTTFVIESRYESEGRVEQDGMTRLQRDLQGIADIYVWPHDQREHNERGEYGTLHVKCAVADARNLLISSANLTGFALNLNMEMGVLITGGHLPVQVQEHLTYLVKAKVLKRI